MPLQRLHAGGVSGKRAAARCGGPERSPYMPHILSSNARFFKIHAKALVDDPGALLQASAGGHVEAKIRVVVLDLMKVELAFGKVVVPADDGHPVFHADKPSDPQQNEIPVMLRMDELNTDTKFEAVDL
jgi:hypothetical protein